MILGGIVLNVLRSLRGIVDLIQRCQSVGSGCDRRLERQDRVGGIRKFGHGSARNSRLG